MPNMLKAQPMVLPSTPKLGNAISKMDSIPIVWNNRKCFKQKTIQLLDFQPSEAGIAEFQYIKTFGKVF